METNADQSTGRHRRRHHHRKHSAFVEFVSRNRLDLSIAFLFLFGIFLLVERFEIKETIWAWIRGWMVAIYLFVADLFGTIGGLEGSDLIGIGLCPGSSAHGSAGAPAHDSESPQPDRVPRLRRGVVPHSSNWAAADH